MTDRLEEFRTFRERMNARILEAGNRRAVDTLDRLNDDDAGGPETLG